MDTLDFEQQLKEYKEKLNPITLKLFYPHGECEVDYISSSLAQLMESKISLKLLHEIHAVVKGLMKFNNPCFPYATYSTVLKKYGDRIDQFEIILMLSFIRFGATADYMKLSDEGLKWIYSDAYELARKFEIIDTNTRGDEMAGAYGRFGYDKTNPIPVRGFLGIDEYFGKLRSNDGGKVGFERIGSFSSVNIHELIDGYKISWQFQQETELFISIYNSRTSGKAPDGFILIEKDVEGLK